DHYQKFLDGEEDILYIKKEDDPFWEPVEDLLLGTANVFLQSLAYSLDFDDEICIVDYKGLEQGRLGITLSPCAPNGKAIKEEQFVDQPEELLGKPYSFKLAMRHIEINDERYNKGMRIRYKVFNEPEFAETGIFGKQSVCANVKQSRIITIPSVDYDWLSFFENGCIIFQIYVTQEEAKPDHRLFKMSTRELKLMEQKQEESNVLVQTNTMLPGDPKLKSELTLLQRKYNRLEQKEKRIQTLCRDWENKPLSEHEYQKFYKLMSAVAFSSGTKLKTKATIIGKNKKNGDVEIYLFGSDEQEYLNDIEHQNTDKQKYWEEYYRKTALKQRRSSLAFRNTLKSPPLIPIMSSVPNGQSSQQNGNILLIGDNPYIDNSHLSLRETKSLQEQQQQNGKKVPKRDSNFNLRTKTTLPNEKNSSLCLIQ
ncbi:unnamed protein product, partial [Didymodactylos carnosus]